MKMVNRLYIIIALLLLITASCRKDKNDLLRGVWQQINVADINDPYIYEWEMSGGNLNIYRRLKEDPSNEILTDKGNYILETGIGTKLRLMDLSNPLYNAAWDVVRLNESILVIKLDIVGGVILLEFEKKE